MRESLGHHGDTSLGSLVTGGFADTICTGGQRSLCVDRAKSEPGTHRRRVPGRVCN